MLTLRQYQEEGIEKTREAWRKGKRRPLLVYPVGSGKTVMFSYFASEVSKRGKSILVLAHRIELLDQIAETLSKFNVRHSFIASGRFYDVRMPVQVGSVFTVAKRLNTIKKPDVIIIDEAHHATNKTTWGKVILAFPNAFVIGVTATAWRLSGEALGDIFDDIIIGPSTSELIAQGHLSPYKIYAPGGGINTDGVKKLGGEFHKGQLEKVSDKASITGDAIEHYRKLANGKRAIVFCVSVVHANHVAEQFRAAGYVAEVIDGKMESSERKSLVDRFRKCECKIMVSIDVVNEGFDLDAIEVVISLRKTCSLSLWRQQTGRGLRKMEGKAHAIILDHAGNCLNLGLPDDEIMWSLKGNDTAKKSTQEGPKIRLCKKCFAAQRPGGMECRFCGQLFEIKPREVEQKEGELEEIDLDAMRREKKREQSRAVSMADLIAIGKRRGYQHPERWAYYLTKARQGKRKAKEAV